MKHPRHRSMMRRAFSLTEALCAIGLLGIGAVGALSLISTGLTAAAQSVNMTDAALEAQSLLARVLAQNNERGERVYLKRITAAAEGAWIQAADGAEVPVPVEGANGLFWQGWASHRLHSPPKGRAATGSAAGDELPKGLYQITLSLYRNWTPGSTGRPVVYTTLVNVND